MTTETTTTTDHRRPRHRTLVIGAAVLLSTAIALAVLARPVDATVTEQPSGHIDRIDVDIDAGAITLRQADELTVEITSQSSRFAGAPTVTTSTTEGALEVTGRCPWTGIGRCRTDVTLAIPSGTTIHARTGAGPVDANDLSGTIELRTAAGGIHVRDIAGDLQLHTAVGSIDGQVVTGTVDASSAAGSITLTVTDALDHLRVRTTTGSVQLLVPDGVYAVDAHTTMGRVRVETETAADARRTIDARTEVGDVLVRSSDTP